MQRPFLLTLLFLVATAFMVREQALHTPLYVPRLLRATEDHSGPMGAGDQQGRLLERQWNIDRLHDPATGRIPDGIREKERAFARSLPARSLAKSLTWTHQGPRNRGGRTRAFGVDVDDPNVLLAGSATGGIWRSTDQGITWTKTSAPLEIQNTSCLSQDLRHGHTATWYCGTGENYGVVSGTSFEALLPGDGIFKSNDDGVSWTRLSSTVTNDPQVFDRKGAFKHVNSIVVDPLREDSDVVLAAIFDGIVRSNDGGLTWNTVLGLDTTINPTSLYTEVRVSPTGIYYAAIGASAPYRGVYRSTDGLHWTNIGASNYPAGAQRSVIAIDPSNENTVWFFCESPNVGTHGHSLLRYTYLSGDGSGTGGQWDNRSANLPNGTCAFFYDFDFGYINTQSSYDMCIAVHPTDPNTVYIGGTSVYRSTNGWTTPQSYKWIGGYKCDPDDPKDYVYPDHHPDQHWLEFAPSDPTRLYSTNDGGVHVTTDPLADSVLWNVLNDGYITSQFYTISMEEGSATTPYLLGGAQDNGCWLCVDADPTVPWASVHGSDGAYCAIPQGRPFMLMSSQSGKLYKKQVNDQGDVLAYERIDPVGGTTAYNFINQFVLDPVTNDQLYWCSANKIWRNTDLAGIAYHNEYYDPDTTNWELLTAASISATQRFSALDISAAEHNSLWLGTTSGRLYRIDSLDTTPVRTQITSPEWPSASYISCIAPNDFDPNEWLLTFSNYGVRSVFHTTDHGASWTSVSGNIEQFPDGSGNGPAVFWGLIYPTWGHQNDRYFIGTSVGLFSTALLDGDNTVWEQEDPDGIGNVPIDMLVARGSDGLVAVGTHGSGVYTAHLPAAPVGIVDPPSGIALGPAWPNPTTTDVSMDYYLSGSATMLLDVYDMNGRPILRRSLGHREQGNAHCTWDLHDEQGDRVPAGTYFLHLSTSNGGARTERVVVLR